MLSPDLVDDPARRAAREPFRARVTAARRLRWGADAALVAVTLGSVGGFWALARMAVLDSSNAFDRRIVRAVGRVRSPVNTRIARAVTSLGSAVGATAIALGAVLAARRSRRLALQIALGSIGGGGAELLIKRFFKRTRPSLLDHLEEVTSTSFPSGHAMAASSLYLTLAFVAARSRRLRPFGSAALAAAGAIAASVAATRVYLGVHWPTDVLAGLSLGTAWASTTEAAFDLAGAERALGEAGVRDPPGRPL